MDENLSALLHEAAEYRALTAVLTQKRWYRFALGIYKAVFVLVQKRGKPS